MRISVTQGEVHVELVQLLVDHPDVKVLMIDSNTKYWDIVAATCIEDGAWWVELLLVRREDTLNAIEMAATEPVPSMVEVHVLPDELDGHWVCDAVSSRYTGYVYLWRVDREAG